HVVKEEKTWAAAQQYCRENFTDLATIDNMTQMREIKREMQDAGVGEGWRVWIGLKYGGSLKWQWSLADEGFYGENETEFRNWNTGHNSTHPYVLVQEWKTWRDAQRYCRDEYTDLASLRNQTENDKIYSDILSGLGNKSYPWIGLFRDAWEWSDGSNSSFRHWAPEEPNFGVANTENTFCARMTSSGLWIDAGEQHEANFICYEDQLVLVNEQKTWKEALEYCREHHEDLVSVTSEKIQRWVEGWAKGASTPYVWLGLRYSCNLGFWFWVSGEIIWDYDNWASDHEKDRGCTHKVGAVTREWDKWVSFEENAKHNFICTKEDNYKKIPNATVVVVSSPPFYSGDVVTLRCDISEYSDWHRYSWLKDNSPVPGKTSQTINITLPLEAGQYQCSGQRNGPSMTSSVSSSVDVVSNA
ncbi:macrophage mannose receptor 1-like, partial [Engraulis encrasicolus]|uniref:macrophage mannose receptor 1-like n=1 Tax=Engraulis encrasicolus TaxID=184585 RepID=UPI002FD0C818